jgi:hypothetical protein
MKLLSILLQTIGAILIVFLLIGATLVSHLHFSYLEMPVSHLLFPGVYTLAISIGLIGVGKIINRGIGYSPGSQSSSKSFSD